MDVGQKSLDPLIVRTTRSVMVCRSVTKGIELAKVSCEASQEAEGLTRGHLLRGLSQCDCLSPYDFPAYGLRRDLDSGPHFAID